MSEIYGPADVVAGMVGFLRGRGIPASTRVPNQRIPGMVRVTRIGGQPLSLYQDDARLLIEIWESTHELAFDLARRIWGMLAAVSEDDQSAFPGLVTYRAAPDIPVQHPDEYSPELDRHQMTVRMLVRMQPMEVTA